MVSQLSTSSQQKNKIAHHPVTGLQITFDAAFHTYTDETGLSYTSVTRAVKDAFPLFDADGSISERVALREGLTPEQVRSNWKEAGRIAARSGTRLHETAEAIIRGEAPPYEPESEEERANFSAAWGFIQRMRGELGFEILDVEQIVFSPHLRIAGTVDLIARRDGMIWVMDWKTNREIVRENRYGGFGFWPIERIPDINFEHYTLQLNVYQTIMALEGYFEPEQAYGRALLHVRDGNVEVIPVREDRNAVIGALLVPYIHVPF